MLLNIISMHNPKHFYSSSLKENFWPWIPNPGESTIGNWSPDYPLKVHINSVGGGFPSVSIHLVRLYDCPEIKYFIFNFIILESIWQMHFETILGICHNKHKPLQIHTTVDLKLKSY